MNPSDHDVYRTPAVLALEKSGKLGHLAGNILHAIRAGSLRSVLVTSCHDGEGKTVNAVSIAYGLAREAALRTVLVDANASTPSVHTQFGIEAGQGFAEVVREEASIEEVLVATDEPCLSVITVGSSDCHNLGLAYSHACKALLETLKAQFDLVVIDGPSIYGTADAAVLANVADGIVLVVECERTHWEVVRSGTQKLKDVGGHLVGAIMNRRRFYIPGWLYE